MKTVTLKFVIDDSDESAVDHEVQSVLEVPLNEFPLMTWHTRQSTKKELLWRKKCDKERGRT
jgi:hypothetical protein